MVVSSRDNSTSSRPGSPASTTTRTRSTAGIFDPRRAEIDEWLNIPTVASVAWSVGADPVRRSTASEEMREALRGGTLLDDAAGDPDDLIGKPDRAVEARQGGHDRRRRARWSRVPARSTGSTFQKGDIAHFVVTKALWRHEAMLQPVTEES